MSDVTQLAVEGCADCPFMQYAAVSWCIHPRAPVSKDGSESDAPFINDPLPPDWCPLRTSPVLVSLKK